MRFPRSSGVLLHVTSLPTPSSIGDLGPAAFRFVDFLAAAGQSIWQVLPLSPTVACDSPYSAYSAFAGNPLMISLEKLATKGLLTQSEIDGTYVHIEPGARTNYARASQEKNRLLKIAFQRFQSGATNSKIVQQQSEQLELFAARNVDWLTDFSLFSAIGKKRGTFDWTTWDDDLVSRDSTALENARHALQHEIEYENFVQFIFDEQWNDLKSYANSNNVRLFGDMPIFVAHQSADVWANQEIFTLDAAGKPETVAGVPPDYFSKTGQLWGNPLYRWDVLAQENYRWWTLRFESAMNAFDLLRIDHFRGFEAFWEIPASEKTAVNGQWKIGPGAAPFRAAESVLGPLPIIAEDLGLITDSVHALRDELEFPGMRVLQFGFDDPNEDFHRPSAYSTNSVAYTGTHDNDTLVGWLDQRSKNPNQSEDLLLELIPEIDRKHYWTLIESLFNSDSDSAIVPLQDLLGLSNAARMNVPGQADGNWGWKLPNESEYDSLAARLRQLTASSNRLPAMDADFFKLDETMLAAK